MYEILDKLTYIGLSSSQLDYHLSFLLSALIIKRGLEKFPRGSIQGYSYDRAQSSSDKKQVIIKKYYHSHLELVRKEVIH
jgi:hypothetical protein